MWYFLQLTAKLPSLAIDKIYNYIDMPLKFDTLNTNYYAAFQRQTMIIPFKKYCEAHYH